VVTTDNGSLAQTADSAATCVAGATNGFTGHSRNDAPFQPNATFANSGKLRRSGVISTSVGNYTIGDHGTVWKDVLRLIYTGRKNTDGFCASVDRYTRCTDPVRQAVVNDWFGLVEDGTKGGVDTGVRCDGTNGTPNNQLCNKLSNPAAGGLRHAFRREDNADTTSFFLSTLGLSPTVRERNAWVSGLPLKPTSIDGLANMFCDGGQDEGYVP
jgi:hypothetical protein